MKNSEKKFIAAFLAKCENPFACVAVALLLILLGSGCGVMWGDVAYNGGPARYFLYVGDVGAVSGIYAYSINSGNGILTSLPGSPFTGTTSPIGTAGDPLGRFLYVADNGNPGVYAYTINATTGALTAVQGSPFFAGASPISVTVDATGHFVYVADQGSSGVYAYGINALTGALSLISGSPFLPPSGGPPQRMTSDPTGHFVFSSLNAGSICGFTINSQTGALTVVPGSPFAAGTTTRGITFDSSGQYLYASSNGASSGIYGYAVQGSGALTALTGSPFSNGNALAQELGVAGQYLYAEGNISTLGIYGNIIGATSGALVLMSGSALTAATFAGVTTDPTGQFVYGVATTGGLYGSVINSLTGSLTPIAGSPFQTSTSPFTLTTVKVTQPTTYK